uniref:Uncharacterized protein n=1 Tax=Candidatus Kentrum sp. FM TaxID=2126340 RepID=A0A450TYQ6_9GAMM|nr:MAG: hypothetical protein BECKFM1743C_GA0114222_107901 [Candidatus Kentron sp. FM]VFJ74775.1 MAG: hypothetical protein BECKFM1743A_GA0114220_107971 [Candidatus Kentron sp. FM]VFK21536.1 MAG: hypothetical protein BECKFM1743B_GA0114221_107931 [Candidatus Kentron sp. FM]
MHDPALVKRRENLTYLQSRAGNKQIKAIGRKEYTKLRRIFVQIQGARQTHSELCNCRATQKLDDKDKQVGIFFDRNRLSTQFGRHRSRLQVSKQLLKVIAGKEYTGLRGHFVQIQGAMTGA